MVCIYCAGKTSITNSRPSNISGRTWRRHRCQQCHAVFTAEENYQLDTCLLYQSANMSTEAFCKEKLFISIYKAVEHLANAPVAASHLTDTVINAILKIKPRDAIVTSTEVIQAATKALKRFNTAAAVKYALSAAKQPLASSSDLKRFLKD